MLYVVITMSMDASEKRKHHVAVLPQEINLMSFCHYAQYMYNSNITLNNSQEYFETYLELWLLKLLSLCTKLPIRLSASLVLFKILKYCCESAYYLVISHFINLEAECFIAIFWINIKIILILGCK